MTNTVSDFLKQDEFKYILDQSQQLTLPANSTVFRQGDSCGNYLLVLSGSVKVFSRAENGREVILYRVKDGESCTLTTACLFANNLYPAEGITETETTALVIPGDIFNKEIAESEAFRKMVFDQYARRLSDVISLVEDLSFGRIDIRLARILLQLSAHSPNIETTHQLIASELGTAREVISRQLKEFERKQLITLKRGSIYISDTEGLSSIAETSLV